MTQECKPADGTADGSLHWVSHPMYGMRAWKWRSSESGWPGFEGGGWDCFDEPEFTPQWMAWHHWSYVAPAHPPTAETPPDARDVADARRFRLLVEQYLNVDAIEVPGVNGDDYRYSFGWIGTHDDTFRPGKILDGIRALIDNDIANII